MTSHNTFLLETNFHSSAAKGESTTYDTFPTRSAEQQQSL